MHYAKTNSENVVNLFQNTHQFKTLTIKLMAASMQ